MFGEWADKAAGKHSKNPLKAIVQVSGQSFFAHYVGAVAKYSLENKRKSLGAVAEKLQKTVAKALSFW